MAKTICVTNQKGGVGKTTTSYALGLGLKKEGFRVLCVDLDPQGNLSFSFGAETEESDTVYEVIKGRCSAANAIQHTELIDVIPSNIVLSGVDIEFTQTGREFLLKDALSEVQSQYDYIIIDTPPSLNVLTVNAFVATDIIIIPMVADIFSLQGITQLYDAVENIRKYYNPSIKIEGILLTRYNGRTVLSSEIKGTAEMIAKELNTVVFNTTIRASVSIQEAQASQNDLYDYAPKNSAVMDYLDFIKELLSRGDW